MPVWPSSTQPSSKHFLQLLVVSDITFIFWFRGRHQFCCGSRNLQGAQNVQMNFMNRKHCYIATIDFNADLYWPTPVLDRAHIFKYKKSWMSLQRGISNSVQVVNIAPAYDRCMSSHKTSSWRFILFYEKWILRSVIIGLFQFFNLRNRAYLIHTKYHRKVFMDYVCVRT